MATKRTVDLKSQELNRGIIEIADREKVTRLFMKAVQGKCELKFWPAGQNPDQKADEVVIAKLGEIHLDDPQPYFVVQGLDITPEPRDYAFLIFFKNAMLLGFKSTYLENGPAGMHFSFPDKVVKIQRRKEMRWPIPRGYEIHVNLKHPHTRVGRSYRLLDVSLSGMAFQVESTDRLPYEAGMILTDMIFRIQGTQIKILKAEVRGKFKDKVGVLFKELEEDDLEALTNYIAMQSVQYMQDEDL